MAASHAPGAVRAARGDPPAEGGVGTTPAGAPRPAGTARPTRPRSDVPRSRGRPPPAPRFHASPDRRTVAAGRTGRGPRDPVPVTAHLPDTPAGPAAGHRGGLGRGRPGVSARIQPVARTGAVGAGVPAAVPPPRYTDESGSPRVAESRV